MSREMFLKKLQYFDDNYNGIVNNHKEWDKSRKEHKDWDKLRKEHKGSHDKDKGLYYSQGHSRVDINEVKHITVNNGNCFVPFFNLNENLLFAFFGQLSNTELGLHYIDGYADNYRDNQARNRNKALQNKIDSVLEYAEAVGTSETTIEEIKGLRNSLDNKHLTKHRLFENLLFWVALLLNNFRNSYIVANATNEIIKDYFGIEDITFTRYAKIENYISTTYTYYDAKGITIHHS